MSEVMNIELTKPSLVPQNMSEAIQLAEMMASAKLCPKDLQKSPADCLLVIQQAVRWQMDPFAVAQECSVISGKIMYSGKLVAAVVNSRANLSGRLSYEFSGQGNTRKVIVRGQFFGENNPREVEVELAKVKTANVQWDKQTDQQLAYHGARVWARRYAPELVLGVYSREEFEEQTVVRPQYAPNPMKAITHNPETGEVSDYTDQMDHVIGTTNGNNKTESEVVQSETSTADHNATPRQSLSATDGAASDDVAAWDNCLAEAAIGGTQQLEGAWQKVPRNIKPHLKAALERRHKPAAIESEAGQ